MLEITTFTGPGFAENAYLVRPKDGRTAVVIDPGAAAHAIVSALQGERLELAAILLTHAHLDHIEGINTIKRHADAPIHLHPADRKFYDNADRQGAQFGMRVDPLPPIDHDLAHDQRLSVAGIDFDVRHVPGHCPGHVLLYAAAASVAFVGDVVFQGSIGRTDLPHGDFQQLMRSIRQHVMTLPDETVLYCGHGPPTTVQEERAFNPFIAPMFGGSPA